MRSGTGTKSASSRSRSNKAAAATTEAASATTAEPAGEPTGMLKSVSARSSTCSKPASSKARSNKAVADGKGASQATAAEADQAAAADANPTIKRRSRRTVRQITAAEAPTASMSLPSYTQLKQNVSDESRQLSAAEAGAIKDHMAAFRGSANVQDQALALYVNAKVIFLLPQQAFLPFALTVACFSKVVVICRS